MLHLKNSALRFAAVPLFVSALALAAASQAHAADQSSTDMDSQTSASSTTDDTAQSPAASKMEMHVEQRIKTLHDKLGITASQEDKWKDVAQAMRDNESNLAGLIQERHANPGAMTAIDDMQSYQKIAQAHADGLQKVIPAFTALYNDMSDTQKEAADHVFSGYEGHDMKKSAKKNG